MFILSDDILDSLICTQCKKYLSVKPVKVYHNRDIKCGRCSGPSDGGVNSLYGVLAEDVLFRCVNRFDGCHQLLAYEDVEEHEKICNATRNYDCPVCTDPFEGTGFELFVHFKENHPNRLLIGKAEFVLNIDYEESRNYLYRKNDLLFFISASYYKNNEELKLNAQYLGATQEAATIFQKFELLSVDEKVVYKTRKHACASEETQQYFKIALTEVNFPNHVIVCKLELFPENVEKILGSPDITIHKKRQDKKKSSNSNITILKKRQDKEKSSSSSPNTIQINQNHEIGPEQYQDCSKELKGKMGKEISHGVWTNGDRASFPFTIDGRHYFYGQDVTGRRWFIREILPTGQMGVITSQGQRRFGYSTVFLLVINDRQFIFCQSCVDWFIRELLPGGIIGEETDHGPWLGIIMFLFTIHGRYYFSVYISGGTQNVFYELLPGGRLGGKTNDCIWSRIYDVVFAYSIHGRHFMYCHCHNDGYWTIHELLPGGKTGDKMSGGWWSKKNEISFPFGSGGRQYFYSQSENNWFIRELLPNGQLGQETDHGSWNKKYEKVFPFCMNGYQLFYCQFYDIEKSATIWCIKLLL